VGDDRGDAVGAGARCPVKTVSIEILDLRSDLIVDLSKECEHRGSHIVAPSGVCRDRHRPFWRNSAVRWPAPGLLGTVVQVVGGISTPRVRIPTEA
jgi:hypothetical protein